MGQRPHFHLELVVMTARAHGDTPADGVWCPPARLGEHALPSLMKKVVAHAMTAGRARTVLRSAENW